MPKSRPPYPPELRRIGNRELGFIIIITSRASSPPRASCWGLFTRIASFLNCGLMASAYFIAHAPQGFWSILNGGELAIGVLLAVLLLCRTRPGSVGSRLPPRPVPAGQARAALVAL